MGRLHPNYGFNTLAVHSGTAPDPSTGARTFPFIRLLPMYLMMQTMRLHSITFSHLDSFIPVFQIQLLQLWKKN